MKEFKSLYKDTDYRNNPKGTWQNAKNILLSKKFNSPVNRDGSKLIKEIQDYDSWEREVVSTMSTNQEIVYFVKTINADVNSEIWVYNEVEDNLYVALRGDFNFNRNIESIFFYDYQGSLIIAFCDGVFEESNTPKIIKLTNTNLPLAGINLLPSNYYDLIELFPNINQGICNAYTSEGNINGVFAYVTFKYVHDDELETRFKDVNTYCSLRELNVETEQYEPRGIKIDLKDLKHNTYSYIKIGIHLIKEDSNISFESDKIKIDHSSKTINIESLDNYNKISNEEILIPKATFDKVETMTNHNDSIIAGKIKTKDKINIQKFANLVTLRPLLEQDIPENIDKESLPKLANNEVYSAFIQVEFKDGSISDWHHIPGHKRSMFLPSYPTENLDNIEGYNDIYEFDRNNYNQEELKFKKFHVINEGNSSRFGYYESEEKYPINDNYNSLLDYNGNSLFNGEDLRGTNLRFFRIPEKKDIGYCYGFKMTSLNFPNQIVNQIKNIRIGFEKRNFDNSILVSNAVLTPIRHTFSILSNQDRNYTELDSTPFAYTTVPNVYSYNRALVLNSEIQELQPKLNFNLTIVNDIIYTGTYKTDANSSLNFWEYLYNYFNVRRQNHQKWLKNKYYFSKPVYTYKLPNNSAQGTSYLDGGLYLNYQRSYLNDFLNQYGNEKTISTGLGYENLYPNNFIPYGSEEGNHGDFRGGNQDSVSNEHKVIVNEKFTPFSFANVSLLNIKKKVYNLKAKDIVSSINTLSININNTLISSNFYCGDTHKSKINPSVKHRTSKFYTYYPYNFVNSELAYVGTPEQLNLRNHIKEFEEIFNVLSPFKNTKLEPKKNPEGYGTFPSIVLGSSEVEKLNALNYGYNNIFNENENSLNNLSQYKSFNFDNNFINYFRYRFYRGSKAPNEAFILNNLKTFLFNNYYEMPNHKGDIVALRSNGYSLYIQMRFSLYLAKIKDVLKTNEQETYLGEGDILDRKPTPMSIGKKGFVGCDHKSACHIFKEGYFTIDHRKGNIVLATDSSQVVTNGITNWLLENLPFGEDYTEILENGDKVYIDEPFKNKGFAIGYDNNYGHVFITKLQGDKSFTLTMDLTNKQFLCYNDFIPNAYDTLNQNVYITKKFLNTNKIELLFKGDKGVYFGVKYPSYIDLIFNASPDVSKHYDAFEIFTTAVKEQTKLVRKTINKIIVFNDYQCSKEIVLDLENKDIIRFAEGKYRVNNIKDIVIDSEDTIIDEQGNINFDNLNIDMFWKNKNDFISNYLIIRLIWDNDTNEDIYLNEFKVLSRKSIR